MEIEEKITDVAIARLSGENVRVATCRKVMETAGRMNVRTDR